MAKKTESVVVKMLKIPRQTPVVPDLEAVAQFAANMKRGNPVHFSTWKKLQMAAKAAGRLLEANDG
jgi:hypothetical protein